MLDGGWYSSSGGLSIDAYGRPNPDLSRYPSSAGGKGLAPLAAHVKSLGLKLGVWMIRGIPREAVEQNLPIYNSSYSAKDAYTLETNCSWDKSNYGMDASHPATADYYRSLHTLLDGWGVDLLKIDCFWPSERRVKDGVTFGPELRVFGEQFKAASARTGHDVVVSLSPGEAVSLVNSTWLDEQEFASLYRVTQDMWDVWRANPGVSYPTDVTSKLNTARNFQGVKNASAHGAFPDLDMLPMGYMSSHGKPEGGRDMTPGCTHLSDAQVRFMMTLWIISRAPLMIGATLPLRPELYDCDKTVYELVTNPEAIQVNQFAADAMEVQRETNTTHGDH